ncbi:MAG: hypothetical protein GXP26_06445 [Planctomycetes bacterium]|nr:hypothetical protein [Planctomycetota bacterium]
MWRSLFLALGAYTCLLGVEALALEKAVLKKPEKAAAEQVEAKVIVPPEWAPWSLMATGAVVVLYSFTIPNRAKS